MKGTLVCACENLRNGFQFDDGKFDEDEHTLADDIGIVEVMFGGREFLATSSNFLSLLLFDPNDYSYQL